MKYHKDIIPKKNNHWNWSYQIFAWQHEIVWNFCHEQTLFLLGFYSTNFFIYYKKTTDADIFFCNKVFCLFVWRSDRLIPEFKQKPKYRNFGLAWNDTETEMCIETEILAETDTETEILAETDTETEILAETDTKTEKFPITSFKYLSESLTLFS